LPADYVRTKVPYIGSPAQRGGSIDKKRQQPGEDIAATVVVVVVVVVIVELKLKLEQKRKQQ